VTLFEAAVIVLLVGFFLLLVCLAFAHRVRARQGRDRAAYLESSRRQRRT
jgi:cbb3-type cytochrome oxidase subunit 3